jgi:hypothetical protein
LERQHADLICYEHNFFKEKKTVLWIRIGFNADADPGSNPDPDPGQTLLSKKYNSFYMEKGWNSVLSVNFGQGSCSRIRIRIGNADPDPGEPQQCGAM